ncbi:hypothetical protein RUM43_005418 [Polyplax serrata]|uniref:Uncharacterized protein n=1 Tax=Polyplax serrata TaxID=468196 RepID=A0AAN8NQ60_POLSC
MDDAFLTPLIREEKFPTRKIYSGEFVESPYLGWRSRKKLVDTLGLVSPDIFTNEILHLRKTDEKNEITNIE